MIYLLGTRHCIQTEQIEAGKYLSEKIERFKCFVATVAQSHGVSGIAEESNDEIVESRGKSVAQLVAENAQPPLQYILCEPSTQQRRALGIPTGDELLRSAAPGLFGRKLEAYRDAELLRYFPLRENFWVERLRESSLSSVLFILGPNHVLTFARRLAENKNPCEVVSIDWYASDEAEYGPLPLEERPI